MVSNIRLGAWAPERRAALAEILRGYGFEPCEEGVSRPCLATIAPASGAAAEPRDTALILLGEGGAVEAPGIHRLKLPVRLGALIALLRRLEQVETAQSAGETVGPYRFHGPERLLLQEQSGEVVRLTDKEAALLSALVRANGAAVPREKLLESVWGYDERMTTHTLETHIYRLRQKLGLDADAASLLEQSEEGYRLVK